MPSYTAWSIPPPEPHIEQNEIHLWRASLDWDASILRRLEDSLAPEEKSRAHRFVFPRDRNHFIAARGILREILGAYLRLPPSAFEFAYGAQGKPALAGAGSGKGLRFNLSHAGGLATYAFSRGHDVGVDLEPIRPDFATEDIAERFFSPAEVEDLRSLPPESRAEGFFLCWTRKEAYIKARGEGLQIPLHSFRVTLTPSQPEKLESVDASRWSLHSFEPAQGYAGALVAEARDPKLRFWQWEP